LVDRIPKISVFLKVVPGRSIQVVLECIGQERPGEGIISGINRIKVKGNKFLRCLREQNSRLRRGCRKGGLEGGIWKSSQGLGDDGLDEIIIQIRLGGWACRVNQGTGR